MPKGSKSASTTKRKSAGKTPRIEASTSPAWVPFSERLIGALQSLVVGQWLVLQKQGELDWVQYAAESAGRFRVETKSNWYREPDQELNATQIQRLNQIGWNSPTGSALSSTPQDDPDGSPNFWLDLTLSGDAETLISVTERTFTEVLCVAEPDDLLYEAYYASGDSLSLPDLGLKPLIAKRDTSQNPQLRNQLKAIIHEMTGLTSLDFDEVDDLGPIKFGEFSAYLRLVESDPYFRIYCPIIDNAESTLPLLEKINSLNCAFGHLHFCLLNESITCVSDVLIAPFNTSYVTHGVANFLQVCEELGTEIREEFDCYKPSSLHLTH